MPTVHVYDRTQMQNFQKHVEQGLFSFNSNFVFAISINKILGFPNTSRYFLLCHYINKVLVY